METTGATAAIPVVKKNGQGSGSEIFKGFAKAFRPNEDTSRKVYLTIIVFQVVLGILLWNIWPNPVIPKPMEIIRAFGNLWMNEGLAFDLLASLKLFTVSISLAVAISLAISYLTVMDFFKPLAGLVSKLRYWSFVGLSTIFTLTLGGGETLKVSLLVFGISVYLVTSMAEVVQVTQKELDYARTLRMSEWEVVWHTIVMGKRDEIIEVIRQNCAIGWMMLAMAEGLVRSGGGIGVVMLNQNKYFNLDSVYAIQFSVLIMAILLDFAIRWFRGVVCPYTVIKQERR